MKHSVLWRASKKVAIMSLSKAQKIRFLAFLIFFGVTGFRLIMELGTKTGIHITLLIWSFFILCVPIPGNPLITTTFLRLFTKRALLYSTLFIWLGALALNIYTYFSFPLAYLNTSTTFFLYRIIANPWPYWLIIGMSAFAGAYRSVLVTRDQIFLSQRLTKNVIIGLAIGTFFYLSYLDIVVFIFANTC